MSATITITQPTRSGKGMPPMTAARLNIFQRLVRQWDDLHPYNAAQIMRIEGSPDLAKARQAWHDALESLGLGRVRVVGHDYHHECLNGDAISYTVSSVSDRLSLDDYITAELNRPFLASDDVPFRPFILPDGDNAHWAGVTYQHWVADSASIRLLLREWFLRMFYPSAANGRRLRQANGGYWRFFGPEKAHWQLGEGILSSLRWGARFKRVRRIENGDVGDFSVRFTLHRPVDLLIDPLRAYARAHSATVNDVFLAAIAEACDRYVPAVRTPRRQDLALGTIVDLRPHAKTDLSDVFGLFLGFTSVICRPRHFANWDTLLSTVARQAALHKKTGVPQASVVRMLAGLAAGRFLNRKKVVNFYRKRVPLAGGISNVNMNACWPSQYHPEPMLDYVRVSPTGPMMPLVFTTTTLGQGMNVGLTYRPSVIRDDLASQIAAMVLHRLSTIAGRLVAQNI
jgi:hypothetical protein